MNKDKSKVVRLAEDVISSLAKHRVRDDETINQVLRRVLALKQKPIKKPINWSEYDEI